MATSRRKRPSTCASPMPPTPGEGTASAYHGWLKTVRRTSSVTRPHRSSVWTPSISTSGSTTGTNPASWHNAAQRASACIAEIRHAEVTQQNAAIGVRVRPHYTQEVMLEGLILKPSMVLPGTTCPKQDSVDDVADVTVRRLLRAVPAAVPGIAFLSGGQSAELASARLNAMNVRFNSRLPWAPAFSFARAIQQPALEIWQGKDAHVSAAQQALNHRARCNRAARRGEYRAGMERPSDSVQQLAKAVA